MADVNVFYFKNTNEVYKISKARNGNPAAELQRDPEFFGQLSDPTFTAPASADSVLPREEQSGKLLAQDGSMIADPGTNTVRLAIQSEWETFIAGRATLERLLDAKGAQLRIFQQERSRKAFIALVKRIIQLHNLTATQVNGIKSAIADASTLAQIKSAVAALPNLPDSITLQQAKDALLSDISPED